MSFNYGLEKKKFDREWDRLHKEYRAAGMDEAAIKAMYEFDWQRFNAERAYRNHTQGMPDQRFDDDGDTAGEDKSALLVKFFDSFAAMPKDTDDERRDGWLDEIESEELSAALRRLSTEDIELLTLYAFDGYGVTEIAAMQGVTHPTISKKLKRIKKILKNF
jgi:RNA polymerase sigma factor (sigma-70 family)|nr:sigma-70 family RNA polymerase sigma factor [uncultured Acetatifactor sp.]